MSASAGFTGAWLVSEYVYNSDGAYAGIVRQRRSLRPRDDGDLDVVQHCFPGPELSSHAMGEFSGERTFALRVDGRVRRYLGPDVVGIGLGWGQGALTGSGVWPRFGHNFTSFSLLPSPERQITGGQFFNAGERIANIIGLAVPDSPGAVYPVFAGPSQPADIAAQWQGVRRRLDGSGAVIAESRVARTYEGERRYSENGFGLSFISLGARLAITGALVGIGKRIGWMTEGAGVAGDDFVTFFDLLDPLGGNLISIRRWARADAVRQVEVVMLKPG